MTKVAKNENVEAVARFDIDSKTNFTGSEKYAFSPSDFTTNLELVASTIDRMMRPGKVIRLYRCFCCDRHFAAARMSPALVVCRACYKRSQSKGRIARQNVIDRITNSIRIFLRGLLEVR